MARQRYFPFGNPPFEYFAERMLAEAGFRKSLLAIVNISDAEFDRVSNALSNHPSFLSRAAITQVISANMSAGDAKILTDVILRLYRTIRISAEGPKEAMESLKSQLESATWEGERPDPSKLTERLTKVIVKPTGLLRQKKAETLAEATGSELKELGVFCDVRPVFDEERSSINGVVILTTLHLEVEDLDGRILAIECRMTEKQIDKLCKESDHAKRKIVTARKLLTSKQIDVADTSESVGT